MQWIGRWAPIGDKLLEIQSIADKHLEIRR